MCVWLQTTVKVLTLKNSLIYIHFFVHSIRTVQGEEKKRIKFLKYAQNNKMP